MKEDKKRLNNQQKVMKTFEVLDKINCQLKEKKQE